MTLQLTKDVAFLFQRIFFFSFMSSELIGRNSLLLFSHVMKKYKSAFNLVVSMLILVLGLNVKGTVY